MAAYYNELEPFAAAWLRELIKAGLIADGDVDERSIEVVQPEDVRGYTQCHWFAGIGGWSYALRLAGWPDSRECWTFSCPCQRFSSATRGRAVAADLWPAMRRLVRGVQPRVFFAEQVATAVDWFDGVCADLEPAGYEIGAAVLPALSVGQDHRRERLYFAGHSNRYRESVGPVDAETPWMPGSQGDAGRVVPAHGVSSSVAVMRGFGNAIVPQVAAAFIEAYLERDAERVSA